MATIIINNFEITNNGQELIVDIETLAGMGSIFTSALLWKDDTFKDPDLGYDLTYKLQQLTNKELFTVTAQELNIESFIDIYFIELQTTNLQQECENSSLGITYNLQSYHKCMLNFLLESQKNSNNDNLDIYENNLTITTNLLINSIEKSLEIGYYIEAIDMLKKLKKICNISNCKNCQQIICNSCSKSIMQT